MLNKNQLNTALTNALGRLYTADEFLIKEDVNERSISYRLAMYLQFEINRLETGWNVDCEYNRIGTSKIAGEFLTKKMKLRVKKNITSEDTKATSVFPDINIHHRGEEGFKNNLLVIEIKKNKNKDEYDFQKLGQYCEQLKYQWGTYLNIELTQATGYWWKKDILLSDHDVEHFYSVDKTV